jgi:hypothetical protein
MTCDFMGGFLGKSLKGRVKKVEVEDAFCWVVYENKEKIFLHL